MNERLEEQLIKKQCARDGCFQTFKAYPSGRGRYCSVSCAVKDGEKAGHYWADLNKASFAESRQRARGSSAVTKKTSVTERNTEPEGEQVISAPSNSNDKGHINEITMKTRRSERSSESSSGQEETETGSGQPPTNGGGEPRLNSDGRSLTVVTEPTQAELSVDSFESLPMEGLSSMRLLHRSANRLMTLIEECVSDSDLARSTDGNGRVESHRIEQAVQAANALAGTIQVQANLLKALTGLKK